AHEGRGGMSELWPVRLEAWRGRGRGSVFGGRGRMSSADRGKLREVVMWAQVVHMHGVWDAALVEAGKIARGARVPYVLTPHGMLDEWALSVKAWKKKAALWLGRRELISGASRVHALSAYEQGCVERGGFHSRVVTVPNGVDLGEVDPRPERGRFRAEHPELGDDPFVVLLARLHEVKGGEILVGALKGLLKTQPRARVVFAGPDEGAGGLWCAAAREAGVEDRVHFVGPVYGRKKYELMVDAAAFCLPSGHEGFSMSVAEALASRVPVVISEECHFDEVGKAGAGWVVKREVGAVQRALEDVFSDPAGAAERANRGRALIEGGFTWDRIGQRLGALYAEALVETSQMRTDVRPNIVIVTNVETPYRVALHRRIVREIPEVRLSTLYTHGKPDQPWTTPLAQEINPVAFGEGESVEGAVTPARVLGDWKKGGRIIDWLIKNRVRAVFLSGYNDVGRLRIFRWCSTNRIPVFLVADSNIYGDRASGLRKLAKQFVVGEVIKRCVAVLPFGSAGARYFYRYGADATKVIYCPYEPDYEMIETMGAEEVSRVHAELGLAAGRRRFVYCGRLQPVKRPDLAVSAFVKVAEKLPGWDLVVIGDGPLMPDCRALVPEGLKGRVKFVGFMGDQRKITAVYKGSDVLVVPSDSDAWGLVVNEAACAGMAIISSDVVGAVPELVEAGVNGAVFSRRDEAGLIRAMTVVATDEARLERMKAASREVLANWRRRGDPIIGMRIALCRAGILGGSGAEWSG
ncbi:MAG: glycosyltransferase, partial [Phycisphaerales bacterium]|nr:glycosyltransferase [Phycisphaerales bacterium]